MNTYFLRCVDTDLPTLIELGTTLGALQTVDGVTSATLGGAWDVIGPIEKWDQPGTPVKGPGNKVYIHANLRTPIDLRARANELAAGGNGQIVAALGQLNRFFSKVRKKPDQNGNPTNEDEAAPPDFTKRVFL